MARLGDVFPLIRNGVSIKQIDGAGGLPITRIETIANRVVDRSRMGYANIIDNDRYAEYQLQDGDILMSHINSEKHLGKVARYKSNANEYIIHGMNLLVLRVDRQIMMSEYAEYFFNSDSFLRQIPNITKKSVNQASFNISSLRELFIPIPQLDQQREVVHILDGVCALISLRKQQLAKLDELVKSRFVEMFGDPVENTKKWTVHFLCDVCTKLTDGTHFSPESYETGEYRYVTAKNIKISGFDFSNITYVNADVHNEIYARCNPEYGDVLYIKDGVTTGIAMVNTLHEPFTMLSSVALLKQNRAIVDGTYLCGVLNNQHMYDAIRSDMGGAAITRLTITKLNRIEIPVPPLALQQQFTAFVEQIDKSKLAVQQSIDQLEMLKKSLMQKYFG